MKVIICTHPPHVRESLQSCHAINALDDFTAEHYLRCKLCQAVWRMELVEGYWRWVRVKFVDTEAFQVTPLKIEGLKERCNFCGNEHEKGGCRQSTGTIYKE